MWCMGRNEDTMLLRLFVICCACFLACLYVMIALFRRNLWLPCCWRCVLCAIWRHVTLKRRWPRMQCACTMACPSWWSFCILPVAGHSSRLSLALCVTLPSAQPTMHLWGNTALCPASYSYWSEHTKTHKGWVAAALFSSASGLCTELNLPRFIFSGQLQVLIIVRFCCSMCVSDWLEGTNPFCWHEFYQDDSMQMERRFCHYYWVTEYYFWLYPIFIFLFIWPDIYH